LETGHKVFALIDAPDQELDLLRPFQCAAEAIATIPFEAELIDTFVHGKAVLLTGHAHRHLTLAKTGITSNRSEVQRGNPLRSEATLPIGRAARDLTHPPLEI
jgi:hypothetical protein